MIFAWVGEVKEREMKPEKPLGKMLDDKLAMMTVVPVESEGEQESEPSKKKVN